MHNPTPEAFAALTPAKAKAAALALFDSAAAADPLAADWRGVSYALHAALTAKRASKAPGGEPSPFLPWADYPTADKRRERSAVAIRFADGTELRRNVGRKPGKPWAIGTALRNAADGYRFRVRHALGVAGHLDGYQMHIAVPAFASVILAEDGGGEWSADECNAMTVEARAGSWSVALGDIPASGPARAPMQDAFKRAALMDDAARAVARRYVSPPLSIVTQRSSALAEVGDFRAALRAEREEIGKAEVEKVARGIASAEDAGGFPTQLQRRDRLAFLAAIDADRVSRRTSAVLAFLGLEATPAPVEPGQVSAPVSGEPSAPAAVDLVDPVAILAACPLDPAEHCPVISFGRLMCYAWRTSRLAEAVNTFAAMPADAEPAKPRKVEEIGDFEIWFMPGAANEFEVYSPSACIGRHATLDRARATVDRAAAELRRIDLDAEPEAVDLAEVEPVDNVAERIKAAVPRDDAAEECRLVLLTRPWFGRCLRLANAVETFEAMPEPAPVEDVPEPIPATPPAPPAAKPAKARRRRDVPAPAPTPPRRSAPALRLLVGTAIASALGARPVVFPFASPAPLGAPMRRSA